jgi:hypothetical protein
MRVKEPFLGGCVTIKKGWKVTILVPSGKRWDRVTGQIEDELKEMTGVAVMPSSHGGWVLNMGGRFGTPGIADDDNIVAIRGKRIR